MMFLNHPYGVQSGGLNVLCDTVDGVVHFKLSCRLVEFQVRGHTGAECCDGDAAVGSGGNKR